MDSDNVGQKTQPASLVFYTHTRPHTHTHTVKITHAAHTHTQAHTGSRRVGFAVNDMA